jgi:hypothetical protein
MFKPSFHEGQRLLREDCPEFELEDDDAQLMGVLLSILHYRGNPSNYMINAEELLSLHVWGKNLCAGMPTVLPTTTEPTMTERR